MRRYIFVVCVVVISLVIVSMFFSMLIFYFLGGIIVLVFGYLCVVFWCFVFGNLFVVDLVVFGVVVGVLLYIFGLVGLMLKVVNDVIVGLYNVIFLEIVGVGCGWVGVGFGSYMNGFICV